jgi:Ni,Fe-hydrogenase III small subunit/Pyruvate/2-oxoacid:ferredoxin oxidoreductase delta subunit
VNNLLVERLRQGHRTVQVTSGPADLPERYRGRPAVDPSRCASLCRACADVCPTGAVASAPLRIDLGACLFCGLCAEKCTSHALSFGRDHRLGARSRAELVVTGSGDPKLVGPLEPKTRRHLSRSLKLRQVSAGGCNGCEAELVALGNVVFDAGRFGIQFVASPRHADAVVVTGPVSRNMASALEDTLAAVPAPKLMIAVGACAISGGPFAGSEAVCGGVGGGPGADPGVDLFIPGCPPHPLTILDGLLRLLGRLGGK